MFNSLHLLLLLFPFYTFLDNIVRRPAFKNPRRRPYIFFFLFFLFFLILKRIKPCVIFLNNLIHHLMMLRIIFYHVMFTTHCC